MRRWNAKSHTCSFHIPIWNANNYERISINDVIEIFLSGLDSEQHKGREWKKKKEQKEKLLRSKDEIRQI